MQNSLKTVLMIVGVVLVAYGLYTAFSPETVIDAGPLQIEGKESGFNTQNIVIIALGVVALLGSVMSKKK